MKIIDCHVHCSAQTDSRILTEHLTKTGTDRAVLLACSHSRCLSLVPQALTAKLREPERFFVFAAPDRSGYYLHPDDLGEYMARYAQRMLALGCDGIKLLEGKPQMRKALPIPDFDAPVWEPFWVWAEENAVPFLWHVNDPEDFWDREHAPAFAIAQGWLYDESYVNNEAQYAQVLNVLSRHPRLKVIFAHFFFMSAQLDRLSEILDRYPNVKIDLTPGIEMYENFSDNMEATKAFFAEYSDRICYGTDIGGRCVLMGEGKRFDEKENLRRPEIVRLFLTGTEETEIRSDGHFLIDRPPFVLRPLGLNGEQLQKILGGNLLDQLGKAPARVDPAAVLEECRRLREIMQFPGTGLPDFTPDDSVLTEAEKFFADAL